jgi:thioredoxin 1
MKTKFFLLLVTLFLISCGTRKVATPPTEIVTEEIPTYSSKKISFVENSSKTLSEILEQAKAEKKLVFVDAYATWCAPCKLMDKSVFTDPATATFFDKNFLSYKINIEKNNGPTVKLLYSVEVLPTLLFLDADGNVINKAENSIGITELNDLAKEAILKARN